MFDIIVAADNAWGIGHDLKMPWPRLKVDMKHFKKLTSTASEGRQNAIIMGRKTWDSIGKKALPNRYNFVISKESSQIPGAFTSDGLDTALEAASAMAENTFVIGGGQIYSMALKHQDLRYIYLTKVAGEFDCNIHIPNLSNLFTIDHTWSDARCEEENGISCAFIRLK